MAPERGKIHSLPGEPRLPPRRTVRPADSPVKILYSIDSAPQSYLTLLSDRQGVYVHPVTPGSSSNDPMVGSVALKSAARGICCARCAIWLLKGSF